MTKKHFKNTDSLNIIGYTVIMGGVDYLQDDLDTMFLYSMADIINLAKENSIEDDELWGEEEVTFDSAVSFLQGFCEFKIMALHI